jgi:hypothetical protein
MDEMSAEQYFNRYINDTSLPRTPGVYLGLFADDTHIYVIDHKGYILTKLQRGSMLLRRGVGAGT